MFSNKNIHPIHSCETYKIDTFFVMKLILSTHVYTNIKYSSEIFCCLNTPQACTSLGENAVMIQIWTALITILILKVLRQNAKFNWHLSNLVAFIRLNLFVKIDLQKWMDKPFEEHIEPPPQFKIQGVLF